MSSFMVAIPEALASASADLTSLGSTIGEANAAAAGSTTQVVAAAQDEVSAAISALFGNYGETYQAVSARVAQYHAQFVQALNSGGLMYAAAEAVNASPLQTVAQDVSA
ncbi:PE family protein, partial [Mycobacterium sp.]